MTTVNLASVGLWRVRRKKKEKRALGGCVPCVRLECPGYSVGRRRW